MIYRDKINKWLKDFQIKHDFNLAWFIRYAIGGTVTAVVEFVSFILLAWWTAPWDAIVEVLPRRIQLMAVDEVDLWAIVVSNIISYIVNYFLSKYWVFRSPDTKHRRDAALFFLSCVANLAIVLVSAKLLLIGLELIPLRGTVWEAAVPIIAKIGSNVAAFITVLLFKRFIIWNDTSKY